MRLVQLEIKGFKSFAKETVLNFGRDVIGVVGPNGSGKSNIVDAIRWVLGEQKKGELRLDKMSSVIFNGTKKRKPSNVAQVFLTFDNDRGVLRSEFESVTIGRLLYRNGDSEYRLNGVPCRRKDITELFVDTGIESNSYAIIALGMVDDILADKDNSRLRMLEQAAGISVYKVRKHETQLRLNRTQEDLDRVEDLLHEIDGNLSELEKQAKRTKRYFEIKEQYRELSLDYAYLGSRDLREQLTSVEAELHQAEQQHQQREAEATELEASVERSKDKQLHDEQHLVERRNKLGSLSAKLRSAINERQLAEQKIEYLSQNKDKLTEQRGRLDDERERLINAVANYTQRHQRAEEEEAAFQSAFAKTKHDLELRQAEAEDLRSSVRERAVALQEAEKQLLAIDRRATVVQSRIEAIEQEAASQARRNETDRNRLHALQEERKLASSRVQKLATQLQAAEDAESSRLVNEQRYRDQLDELAPRLRELRSEQQKAENELGLLQAMLDRMEGSPEAVKYLASKQGWKGKFDLLSDVLDIDEDYRSSIEAVLAPYLNCFLVPDNATAAEGLRVLAEAGQALTTILVYDLEQKIVAKELAVPAGTRPALEVVRVPQHYQQLLAILLQGVGVCAESAATVEVDEQQVVVDGSGRQVWTRYSARGGKASKLQGKQTGRRQRVDDLFAAIEAQAKEVGELDAVRVQMERSLTELRSSSGRATLKELRQRHTEAERLHVSAQARAESLEQQLTERKGLDTEALAAVDALRQDLLRLEADRVPLVAARDAASDQQAAADDEHERLANRLRQASQAYNEANLKAIQLQNAEVALARELSYAQDQLAELEQNLQDSEQALHSDGSEIGILQGKVAELDARISSGKETLAAQQQDLSEDEQRYFERRNQLTEWEKKLRQSLRETSDLNALVVRLRERKQELGFRRQTLRDRLQIEFNLDLEAAMAEHREVSLSLPDLEHKISKLKSRLDGYGEINPLAVEAYDAMAERHGNISGQREDILQAMDDLHATITEIDKDATDKLTAAFEAVRGHFSDVFQHLFDADDTADMVMLDPANPLESKIEIIAKPKGKRPQTISQLSGGEKTLTATAFLFALYLIKPAPFCIFDEVDAPLDDTNVEKFNRIIKRFSNDSQFIIVTHNKLTMAAVDTIYGVYMSELGVSSVTQVDFTEFAHSDVLEMVG